MASMAATGGGGGQAAAAEVARGAEVAPTAAERAELEFWERIQAHQKAAAKLPPVEEARTIVARCGRGMLSTISKKYDGFPFGSMVGFAADGRGRPVLAISSLSPHTRDLAQDPRCSLLVSRNPLEQSETLVTLVGTAKAVPEAEVAQVREAYLSKHPNAFWVDFGDFSFVRIEPATVRFTANIATFAVGASVAELPGAEYMGAAADPIAAFEDAIADDWNRQHAGATRALVRAALGADVAAAAVVGADRLGLRVEAELGGQLSKLRLPFPRPAAGRSDVDALLAEMVAAAGQRAAVPIQPPSSS